MQESCPVAPPTSQRVLELGEVEFPRKLLEVSGRDPRHGVHELLEARRVRIQLGEHRLARVLGFILRLARLESLGEVRPELIQASIRHLEDAADVSRAGSVEKKGALGSIRVARIETVAVTLQKLESHQRVREVRYGAWTELQGCSDFLARHRLSRELGEEFELDGGEQRLRRKETQANLHDM